MLQVSDSNIVSVTSFNRTCETIMLQMLYLIVFNSSEGNVIKAIINVPVRMMAVLQVELIISWIEDIFIKDYFLLHAALQIYDSGVRPARNEMQFHVLTYAGNQYLIKKFLLSAGKLRLCTCSAL